LTASAVKKSKDAAWFVYLLSDGRRSYVGITNNPRRRLRQHNGELAGGAGSTARRGRGGWFFVYLLAGFRDRGAATTWENVIKKRTRGLDARAEAMRLVASGGCPPGRRDFTPPRLRLLTAVDLLLEGLRDQAV
jgi:predicted GIY-YIG superfamily endonuclease